MIGKILRLPFYFIAFIGVLLVPLTGFSALLKGGPEGIYIALFCAGIYPFIIILVNAAIIEHFIIKKLKQSQLTNDFANEIISGYSRFTETIMAHLYLQNLLIAQKSKLDEDTYNKGITLAKRHKILFKLMFFGFGLVVVSSIAIDGANA